MISVSAYGISDKAFILQLRVGGFLLLIGAGLLRGARVLDAFDGVQRRDEVGPELDADEIRWNRSREAAVDGNVGNGEDVGDEERAVCEESVDNSDLLGGIISKITIDLLAVCFWVNRQVEG